jgi:hypothetical protein
MLEILALIFFTSTIGTVTGFGTSILMMPVLMMFFPVHESLVFVTIIHWFNGLWRLLLFRKGFDKKIIFTFGVAGILSAIAGAKVAFLFSEDFMIKFVSGFLIIYSCYLLKNPKFTCEFSNSRAIIGGLLAGFVAGVIGMGGAIRAAFLSAFNLPKEIYLANSALLLVLIDSARLWAYFQEGVNVSRLINLSEWPFHNAYLSLLLCILVSFPGVNFGKFLVDRIPQNKFRIGIAVFLLILGLSLLVGDGDLLNSRK